MMLPSVNGMRGSDTIETTGSEEEEQLLLPLLKRDLLVRLCVDDFGWLASVDGVLGSTVNMLHELLFDS